MSNYMKPKIPKGAVKIYDRCLEIKAEKGKDVGTVDSPSRSLWPKELFKHKFSKKHKAEIWGLPDGALLIIGDTPFWKWFEY